MKRGNALLKQKLLCFFSFALLLLSVCPAARAAAPAPDGICLPIIMYHEVKPCNACKDAILPQELEEDLKFLVKEGYHTVTMTQVIDYVNGGDRKSVV